jgi:quercetin dioxygenase-like cupin family protein
VGGLHAEQTEALDLLGVFFEPGEDHWHSGEPNRFMTHLAMLEVEDLGDVGRVRH